MVSTHEITWLAGLLDGEGAFIIAKGSPCVEIQMTDEDVLRRASVLLSIGRYSVWNRRDGYKPVYCCKVWGAHAAGWMMTLYSWMGERRRAKIREILKAWRSSSRAPRGRQGQRLPAACHPERVRAGKGLCQQCYMRKWRSNRRDAPVVA